MKPTTTWILIADGAHARLFANHGPGKGIEAVQGGVINGATTGPTTSWCATVSGALSNLPGLPGRCATPSSRASIRIAS